MSSFYAIIFTGSSLISSNVVDFTVSYPCLFIVDVKVYCGSCYVSGFEDGTGDGIGDGTGEDAWRIGAAFGVGYCGSYDCFRIGLT